MYNLQFIIHDIYIYIILLKSFNLKIDNISHNILPSLADL